MRLRFWGVRGSHPVSTAAALGVGGHTSCMELELASGERLVLDAGTGVIGLGARLLERAGGPSSIDLLLSHLHWDHIQGLPFFPPLYRTDCAVRVWSTRPRHEVDAALEMQMAAPYFPQELTSAGATLQTEVLHERPIEIAGATVTNFELCHPGGCSGFVFEHRGRSIVCASDHEAGDEAIDAELIRRARGADVLILDAQYTDDQAAERRGWGHSTWRQAAELAAAAGVGQLFLFHHDPAHDDAQLERLRDRAREIFPAAELAVEQATVEL